MITGSKKILIISAVVLILGALFFTFSSPEGEVDVDMSASADKEIYAPNEDVIITVNLNNSGDAPTCLSDRAQGNIKLLSVTRDGESVATREAPSHFIEALYSLVRADLKEVGPGEAMDIELVSTQDPGLGARALYAIRIDGTAGMSTFYAIEQPGEYEVQVAYEYEGESSTECENIYMGPTNTSTVTFSVSQ